MLVLQEKGNFLPFPFWEQPESALLFKQSEFQMRKQQHGTPAKRRRKFKKIIKNSHSNQEPRVNIIFATKIIKSVTWVIPTEALVFPK